MSYYDYKKSQEIAAEGYSFYALVMACMRQADTDNLELLKNAFPKVHAELVERYNAPGGLVGEELERLDYGVTRE
jgi:hypothetical protein